MHPFIWHHIYIPILPHYLLEFVQAPTPFVMGVPAEYRNRLPSGPEIVFVDLDNGYVTAVVQVRSNHRVIDCLTHILNTITTVSFLSSAVCRRINCGNSPIPFPKQFEDRLVEQVNAILFPQVRDLLAYARARKRRHFV